MRRVVAPFVLASVAAILLLSPSAATSDPADAHWSALASETDGAIHALVEDGAGNLYAGGAFWNAGGEYAGYVAKWDGTGWSPLGWGMNGPVYALAVDSGGNLYAGGAFSYAGEVDANRVAKWNGTAWSALGSGVSGIMGSTVRALELDSGGNLFVGGFFEQAGGVWTNCLAKWNVQSQTWSAVSGLNSDVLALEADGIGNLYVGGGFTNVGGEGGNYVAKWNGTSWSTLGSGMNYVVRTLKLGNDGSIYAGGDFWWAGGVNANSVAKWNGANWSALGEGMDDHGYHRPFVYSLAMDDGGTLYAGGEFAAAGASAAPFIAKWDGTSWSPMGSGMNHIVHAVVVAGSGNLYAGGQFTTAGGKSANYLAVWDAVPPAAVTNLGASSGRYTATVGWVAPGDDGNNGTATGYDLRRSTNPINAGNFANATVITTPAPGPAGTTECVELSGLSGCTTYYFALKTVDEAGNWSALSNLPSTTTRCSGSLAVVCNTGDMMAGPGDAEAALGATAEVGEKADVIEFSLGAPRPNPGRDLVRLTFAVPGRAEGLPYDLGVFDVAGRRVASLDAGIAKTGRFTAEWDLRGAAAGSVGGGIYFIRLRLGEEQQVRAVTVAR